MSHAADVYARLKEVMGGKRVSWRRMREAAEREAEHGDDASRIPFGTGRDPSGLGAALDEYLESHELRTPLAQAALLADWPRLAGEDIAQHTTPVHVDDGVLVVQCDSTAWATQLRTLRAELVTAIARAYPDARIQSMQFLNPGAPSWKRGIRSVPGRGPRDTYG